MKQETTLIKGTIIKGIGGFYYVEASACVFECKAKGLFRKTGETPLVGDSVLFEVGRREGENRIREILPRMNDFIRPPVANVEVSLIASSVRDPEPLEGFADRQLVMAMYKNTEAALVFNKCDMLEEGEAERIESAWRNTGYPVFFVSAKTGEGLSDLYDYLCGKRCMIMGPSGVGKSSLVNALGGFEMETGEISKKLGRGKHTTRHVQLLSDRKGLMIFDTPGFQSFELPEIKAGELKNYFPEFADYEDECRFSSCVHMAEPSCGVKDGVERGEISPERYEAYKAFYRELKERPAVYGR